MVIIYLYGKYIVKFQKILSLRSFPKTIAENFPEIFKKFQLRDHVNYDKTKEIRNFKMIELLKFLILNNVCVIIVYL